MPESTLLLLQRCLHDLDRLGADIAAAHISAAIDELRLQFKIDPSSTETD